MLPGGQGHVPEAAQTQLCDLGSRGSSAPLLGLRQRGETGQLQGAGWRGGGCRWSMSCLSWVQARASPGHWVTPLGQTARAPRGSLQLPRGSGTLDPQGRAVSLQPWAGPHLLNEPPSPRGAHPRVAGGRL